MGWAFNCQKVECQQETTSGKFYFVHKFYAVRLEFHSSPVPDG